MQRAKQAEQTPPDSVSLLALSKPSSGYAWRAILRNGGAYFGALASVPLLASWDPLASLAAAPVIGLAMYRLTLVMHDCIHGTLFASKRTNRFVGALAGAASGIEFHAFARLHRRHHQIAGEIGDPQGPDYFVPWSASRAAIFWHLARPLSGYNLFKLAQVFSEMRRNSESGVPESKEGFAMVAAAQIFAMAVTSSGFQIWWLAALPLVSAATFGLFFAQLRGFAEHVVMPGVDPRGFVRSHRPSVIDRILLYDLNFNFHHEHHLYPSVPSCRLPALHRHLFEADAEKFKLSSTMMATAWTRFIAAR